MYLELSTYHECGKKKKKITFDESWKYPVIAYPVRDDNKKTWLKCSRCKEAIRIVTLRDELCLLQDVRLEDAWHMSDKAVAKMLTDDPDKQERFEKRMERERLDRKAYLASKNQVKRTQREWVKPPNPPERAAVVEEAKLTLDKVEVVLREPTEDIPEVERTGRKRPSTYTARVDGKRRLVVNCPACGNNQVPVHAAQALTKVYLRCPAGHMIREARACELAVPVSVR